MSYWVYVKPKDEPVRPAQFEGNVTYNVSTMLRRAGIHPAILSGMTVKEVRPVIDHACDLMADNPDYFRQFEAVNGWGTYETTFKFVTNLNEYLESAPDDYVMWWS